MLVVYISAVVAIGGLIPGLFNPGVNLPYSLVADMYTTNVDILYYFPDLGGDVNPSLT